MKSQAATVQQYLSGLPADRRAAIEAVRAVILDNLDRKGLEEGMQYGMIGYYVPHRVFPAGYHCDPRQPLQYAALAAQKQHMAIYLMFVYLDPENEQWLRAAWAKTGKKLDMGKSCIRFKRLEDLALDVLGEAIRRVPAQTFIARYEEILQSTRKGAKTPTKPATKVATKAPANKTLAKKATAKKTVTKVPANKAAAKNTATKKTATKKTATKKTATKKTATKKTATKKTATKKTATKKTTAKTSAAKNTARPA